MDSPEQIIFFPVFEIIDKNGKDIAPRQKTENGAFVYEEKLATVDDIYTWLREIDEIFPTAPSFKILQMYLKPVCVEGLIDPMVYQWMSLESAVDAYGVGALDLPLDLFRAFEMIRSSSNSYEALENFSREQELKTKTK